MTSSISPPPDFRLISRTEPRVTHLTVLAPFGVYPCRSGGHAAVLAPARCLARSGVAVHLFGLGLRRFEATKHLRSFVRTLEPNLVEERSIGTWNWIDYLKRGRTGLPPTESGNFLRRSASARLQKNCAMSDAVVYETPWLFPFDSGKRPRILVCHNVEADLIESNRHATSGHLEAAIQIERNAFLEAEHVICFTPEDRDRLTSRYGNRPTTILPLGVDTDLLHPVSNALRQAARRRLGVENRFVVLFTGAWHPPNRIALERMIDWGSVSNDLSSTDEEMLFVVAGTVGKRPAHVGRTLVTGGLPDLSLWFMAADCCVNPVSEGSGANVKVLESMAWGLPMITTPIGARGLPLSAKKLLLVREIDQFLPAIGQLQRNCTQREELSKSARAWVQAERSWSWLADKRLQTICRTLSEQETRN